MEILVKALVPAVIIWMVGNATRSMNWLIFTSVAAAVAAISVGGPQYAIIDLFFVIGGFVFTAKTVKFKSPPSPTDQKGTTARSPVMASNSSPPSAPQGPTAPARWVSLNPEKEAREEARKAKWRGFRDGTLGLIFIALLVAAGLRLFVG